MYQHCRQVVAATSLGAMLLTHLVGLVHVGCHSQATRTASTEKSASAIQDDSSGCPGTCTCSTGKQSSATQSGKPADGRKPSNHDSDNCSVCKVQYTSDAISPIFTTVPGLSFPSRKTPLIVGSQGYIAPAISLHSGRGPPALG
ncbi:MAG: hypothetical protein AB8B50_00550 [Pirellulaceae bacterium]